MLEPMGLPEGALQDPHELLRDLRRFLSRRARRRDPHGRGQSRPRAAARVLRRRGRRRAAHGPELHGQPGAVPRARARAGGADRRRAARAAGDPRGRAVGQLRAQPRRAHPGQAQRVGACGGLRRVRPRGAPSALRARPAPPAADDARRRPGPHPSRLQHRVLAAGHAGPLLRRGDRDGREPRPRGPHERAHPDAVGSGAPRRLHDGRRAVPAARRGPGRAVNVATAAPRRGLAPELDRADGPAAQGVPGARLGRVQPARHGRALGPGPPQRLGRLDDRGRPQPRRAPRRLRARARRRGPRTRCSSTCSTTTSGGSATTAASRCSCGRYGARWYRLRRAGQRIAP